MKKIIIFLIFLLNLFNIFSFQYNINVNKYYKDIAGNILELNRKLNLNKALLKNNVDIFFKDIDYYHNKSICYSFYGKNNLKYMLKDKYNYEISFNIYKYRYLMFINVIPLTFFNTTLNIDIRHDKNLRHYNIINTLIMNKFITQINTYHHEDMAIELFKFFNDFDFT